MPPSGFEMVRKTELSVCDEKFVFSTEFKNKKSICIADDVPPEVIVSPHSGV